MRAVLATAVLAWGAALAHDGGDAQAAAPAASVTASPPALPDEPQIPVSQPPEGIDEGSLSWALFRTMVVLALVVTLAYLSLNIGLRRLLGIRAAASVKVVTVLERVQLDQKRALFVVEAAGEYLLIGGGDAGLSLLGKLDREVMEKLVAQRAPGELVVSPLLSRLVKGKTPPTE